MLTECKGMKFFIDFFDYGNFSLLILLNAAQNAPRAGLLLCESAGITAREAHRFSLLKIFSGIASWTNRANSPDVPHLPYNHS